MKLHPLVPTIGLAATFLTLTSPADAGLIGVSTATDSYYTINPTTAAPTLISTSDRNVSFSDIAFLHGKTYVTDLQNGASFATYQVDLATGASTFVSGQGGSSNWHGLAANEVAGVMYAIDQETRTLHALHTDGTVTNIGPSGIDGRGMAYDNIHHILYATDYSPINGFHLYIVDVATGAATDLGAMALPLPFQGLSRIDLAYDEDDEVLYLVNQPGPPPDFSIVLTSLYSVDVSTAAVTLIGDTGISTLDGLAWRSDVAVTAVPEKSGAMIPILALLGFATVRRRLSRPGD